jgi:hypothetical protein
VARNKEFLADLLYYPEDNSCEQISSQSKLSHHHACWISENYQSNVYQVDRNYFYYRGTLICRTNQTTSPPIVPYIKHITVYYEVVVRLAPFSRHSVHRFLTLKQAVCFLLHSNIQQQSSVVQSEALPILQQGYDYPQITL